MNPSANQTFVENFIQLKTKDSQSSEKKKERGRKKGRRISDWCFSKTSKTEEKKRERDQDSPSTHDKATFGLERTMQANSTIKIIAIYI